MNHTTFKLRMTFRSILFTVGLLFSGTAIDGSYTVGSLDTTLDAGTGFGSDTPGLAPGYVITDVAGGTDLAWGSAVQPDGKVVVVGQDSTNSTMVVARYNINGTLDTTFATDGTFNAALSGTTAAIAKAVTVLPNGKIVVVGQATVSGVLELLVAQFLPNGTLDTSFGGGAGFATQRVTTTSSNDIANAVAVDASGNIYVVGTSVDTQTNIFVAQYTSAGVLSSSYNSGHVVIGGGTPTTSAGTGITLICIGSDVLAGNGAAIVPTGLTNAGNLVVVGSTSSSTSVLIAELTSAGIAASFGTSGVVTTDLGSASDIGYAVGFQSTGKIIVAGATATHAAVIRYATDGTLDNTFGVAGAGYNITKGTAENAKGLAIQGDDKIVIGGTVTNLFVIDRYLADGSALDITFGTFGETRTDIPGGVDLGNTLSMQQNGSFILAGTTNGNNFAVARYLGDQLVQGAMDLSYNATNGAVSATPANQGYSVYPTDTTPGHLPKVVAMYPLSGSSAGQLYVLTSEFGTANTQLVQLASTGAAGGAVVIAKGAPSDVIADSKNRAVVVGTQSGQGWIAQYIAATNNMVADSSFNGGSVLSETNSTSFRRVAEQKAGRLIAMGQSSSSTDGLLIAYNENGVLADYQQTVCAPFGTGGNGAQTGFITTASSTFYDMLIDASDGIYVVYSDGTNLKVAKYLADGSGLSTADFGTAGIADPSLPVATYTGIPSITFDATFGFIILAVTDTSGNIVFKKIANSAGGAITTGSALTAAATLLSTPVLTKLQCDTDNRLIFGGYDTNDFFVGRCSAGALTLDTTFAPDLTESNSSVQGILKTMYSTNNPTDSTTPARVLNSVCISSMTTAGAGNSSNGAILFGGYENINSGATVSLVGQAVGWTSGTVYTQVNRFPGAEISGQINTSYGTNGAQDLDTVLSLPAGQARAINVITTGAQAGKMLVADSNGTDTTLAMLNSTGTGLDTNAFGTGVSSVTLTGVAQAQAIMVDPTGLVFYILGTDGNVRSLTYGSATVTTFATSALTQAYSIAQQASGRILVSGLGATVGAIVAYTPAGVIDTSFNPQVTSGSIGANTIPGYWYTGVTQPVLALSIGTAAAVKDRIYLAYTDANTTTANGVVRQLLENGTSYTPSSGTGAFTPITTAFSGTINTNTQLRMALDVNGAIVLAAATGASPSAIQAARYNANGTTGGSYGIAAFTVVPTLANQVLENILTQSDGTTLILAAVPNNTPSSATMTIARLTSAFALDTTNFNPGGLTPGYLTSSIPSGTAAMSEFFGLDVVTAGGILIAGDNGTTASTAHPYLGAITQANIVTKVSQSATALGAAGTLDTTFNPAGTTPGFMNLHTELQSTVFPAATTVKALLQSSTGSYYIAGDNGTNSYLSLMSDDDVQTASFGTSGLLTISSKASVAAMLLAQSGALLVAGGSGSSGGHAGWLQSYVAATGIASSGFTAPSGAGNVLDAHYVIAQQSNGRILVAGINAGVGAIIAYNPNTGAVDTTFATNGIYTATGYGAINSILVDSSDNIYFIANESGSPFRGFIFKISADGTSQSASPNNIITNSTVATNNHLAFNQANNITAVGVDTASNTLEVRTILASNLAEASTVTLSVGTTGITTPHATSIAVDLNTSPGKVLVTGYDSNTATPFVMRIQSTVSSGLDTTFNSGGGHPGVQPIYAAGGSTGATWNAAMINADGKITVAGLEDISAVNTAYLMRLYGDEFIGQYLPSVAAGTPGTIDTNFATAGYLSLIGTAALSATPSVVLPSTNGTQYVAFSDGTVARYTNANILDTTFGTLGLATASPAGVTGMIMDGNSRLVLVGTTGGAGWVARYVTGNTGALDTTFSGDGLVSLGAGTTATGVVEQSLGRYIVGGTLASTNYGALFALTNTGTADSTFALGSVVGTGVLNVASVANPVSFLADQYDRLLVAYKTAITTVSLARFTSSGEVDTTFNSGSGVITSAITNADSATQVKVALNGTGGITVAAHINDGANKIAVVAFANGGSSSNHAEYDISGLIAPTLTSLISYTLSGSLNDPVLVGGYQSGTNNMWVARIYASGGSGAAYGLDTTFAPSTGIMQFNAGTSGATGRNLNAMAIYGDGEISIVGTETATSPANNPFMARAYNAPYVPQTLVGLDEQAQGTVDATLGAGVSPNYVTNGITFLATAFSGITGSQIARAAAMQNGNANGVVVVADGTCSSLGGGTSSNIYLNMFDVDGLLNTSFNSGAATPVVPGQMLVLSMFNNQYVNDMVTFTTAAGVSKAILAGYAANTTPSLTGSLLMQVNLATAALDSTFGGLNGNSLGVAFGDAQQLNTVGLQSTGRIVTAGLDQSNNGLVLGYTAAGNLDQSFGQGGTYTESAATTGIYASAIDSSDRLVIAYTVGHTVYLARILADGSGLDTTFGEAGIVTTAIMTAIDTVNLRVAIDGSGNIVVASVVTDIASGTLFKIARYTSGGDLSGSVALLGGTMSLTAFTITKMLVDANNAVVVVGYDNNSGTLDEIVVARLVYTSGAYALDSTFNSTGFIKYEVTTNGTQKTAGAFIHPDGRIIIAGAQHA